MNAMGIATFHNMFRPLVPGFIHVLPMGTGIRARRKGARRGEKAGVGDTHASRIGQAGEHPVGNSNSRRPSFLRGPRHGRP